ncbi:hypothetical protein CKN73_00740 [Carnobacterium divergens]|uniref:O-antigen ligase family protein n=1 Tax=Carnobacterium divergens TaxID=2748 RepID=UPI0010725A50|nr:O-antigen ligase family protein [Carnobacterium divergens]TFJ45004.1 hypothetical protein CKN77_00735 [Carnobacterium divergens]TFJ52073.1 hypothetical protein CKN73_00740 [Carnobacterium divergens]TFJ57650.1 hypothetical protein CKN83_00735 [Carnobacterium divergens]TFJ65665.1 hypothetical protein CKN89_00740 [Carnobacterium divergens]TFJ73970.1 hypothetical protein CKN91_00735 [Carnobacterium divergens]
MTKFEKILLSIFFLELFAGGGGRLINVSVGPLSIRMILFIVLMLVYGIRVLATKKLVTTDHLYLKQYKLSTILISGIVLYCLLSTILGIAYGHPKGIVVNDFLRVAYFVSFFPLAYYISNDRFKIKWIKSILDIAALFMIVFTLSIDMASIFMKQEVYWKFYSWINEVIPGELVFRLNTTGVFYKGHYFLFFAVVLALYKMIKGNSTLVEKIIFFLGMTSIYFTRARGLVLALVFVIIFLIVYSLIEAFFVRKKIFKKPDFILSTKKLSHKLVLMLIVLASFCMIYFSISSTRVGDVQTEIPQVETKKTDKETSNETVKNEKPKTNQSTTEVEEKPFTGDIRVYFIKDSLHILNSRPINWLVGNGYGTEIGGRLTGIEISFLDILVEQGVIGVLLWLLVSLAPFYFYYGFQRKGERNYLNVGLLAGIAGMLLLTNTNPFINSPIGIGFLVIVLVIGFNKPVDYSMRGLKK